MPKHGRSGVAKQPRQPCAVEVPSIFEGSREGASVRKKVAHIEEFNIRSSELCGTLNSLGRAAPHTRSLPTRASVGWGNQNVDGHRRWPTPNPQPD